MATPSDRERVRRMRIRLAALRRHAAARDPFTGKSELAVTAGKSSGRALQRLGRVIRTYKGKKDAIVIDFIDQAPYLLEHTKARIDIYRTEPEFKIILPKRIRGKSGPNKKSKKTKKSKPVQSKKRDPNMSW